ncbi:unnamed protein product [Cercospora beticola]|nr:unnamed protein product [Cercospora beticola]
MNVHLAITFLFAALAQSAPLLDSLKPLDDDASVQNLSPRQNPDTNIGNGAMGRNSVPCSKKGGSQGNCGEGSGNQGNPYNRGCPPSKYCRHNPPAI